MKRAPRRARRRLEHSNPQCALGQALKKLDMNNDPNFQIVMRSPGDWLFLLVRDSSDVAKAILNPGKALND